MNFTREPIIETVITPWEGCKLVVRSSKGNGQEDYYVDAVEVVSFGHSFFFRSLERPKSFLVPVSDYEILELRETRMVLKSVSSERSIKIGGGRDVAPRPPREHQTPQEDRVRNVEPVAEQPVSEETAQGGHQAAAQPSDRMDRKRDRRRRGRRGGRDRGALDIREPRTPQGHAEEQQKMAEQMQEAEGVELTEGPVPTEEQKAPSFISKLFPPPPTLIKETLSRYKSVETIEAEPFPETAEAQQKESREETLFDHQVPNNEQEEPPSREESEFEE